MKILMAVVAFMTLSSLTVLAAEQEVSGVVTLEKGLDKNMPKTGKLFIFARKAGAPAMGTPPVAVIMIEKPQFPQSFSITSKNLMMPNTPFEGPFEVTARYSPTGDALDKSGPEGTDGKTKPIPMGKKDLKIELKAKKSSFH